MAIENYWKFNRRVDKGLSRLAHNQKIEGSNPSSATIYVMSPSGYGTWFGSKLSKVRVLPLRPISQ